MSTYTQDEGELDGEEVQALVEHSDLERLADGLKRAGGFLEFWAVFTAACAVVPGVVLIFLTTTDINGTHHSYVGLGAAAVIGAIVVGVWNFAIARAIRVFGAYISVRAQSDEERHRYQWQGESAREKECPDCFEDVWEQARVCRYCGYRFAPPLTPAR